MLVAFHILPNLNFFWEVSPCFVVVETLNNESPCPEVGNLLPAGRMRSAKAFSLPATFYFHPARDFFSVVDTQQWTAEIIVIPWQKPFLWSSPPIRRKKRPEFLAKTFFCLRHRFVRKKARISCEDLSLLVRWNGGGPLESCWDWVWPTSSKDCRPLSLSFRSLF